MPADNQRVKKFLILLLILLIPTINITANRIQFAEQYYNLYHLMFYQYPDDTMESIHYLELALKARFSNPNYALARIDTKAEWEQYRYLFKMHVNLKLVQLHLTLGSKWDKRAAYFYNYPWKKQNLESLEMAEGIYRKAYYYWGEAVKWARKIPRLRFHLEEIQYWEDEYIRIRDRELDYRDIIDEQLARVEKVRRQFEVMDEDTY